MEEWIRLVRETSTNPEDIAKVLGVEMEGIQEVHSEFPLRLNPYYLGLIKEKGDAIWRQSVPDVQELINSGEDDPLAEDDDSPTPHITHRYPDRVLFYVNSNCAMYCRFCTRKRKVGNPKSIHKDGINAGLEYIKQHPEIRDVIVSGGDPLMLRDVRINDILKKLRAIQHIEIIRIGTRIPVTLPQRITKELCEILKSYHPLYINTHFNHPQEITPESSKACNMLADAGIPLGNQTVLLKGVNDDPKVIKELMQKLLKIRVRPYYLFQADLVKGTSHFQTPVQKGLDIIEALRGHTSGLAIPHFVIDAPGGGGKIALIPNPISYSDENEFVLKNYKGNLYRYPSKPKELGLITRQ